MNTSTALVKYTTIASAHLFTSSKYETTSISAPLSKKTNKCQPKHTICLILFNNEKQLVNMQNNSCDRVPQLQAGWLKQTQEYFMKNLLTW